MAQKLKLFYASDIHGSEKCFLKFVNAGKFYGANALVLGGDITGKMVVPLIKDGPILKARFLGQQWELHGEDEAADLEKSIRMNGFYPVRLNAEEHRNYQQDEPAREKLVESLIRKSLERWMTIAEERLRGTGIRCFINPGNDDDFYVDEILSQSSLIENGDGQVSDLDDHHQMLTIGYSNRTPFDSPRELEEVDLDQEIRKVAKNLDSHKGTVFTIHVPPYRTGLDDAPKLENMQVVTKGGQTVMEPVGSSAVRGVIEDYQPLLGLHGHIHESRGSKKLGRSVCINPGSEYSEGVLRGALVTLAPKKVLGYQLVSA